MPGKTKTKKDATSKIEDLLAKVEGKFGEDIKWSIADYIRLLQAQQEFDRETPRDIEVTWVDPAETKSDTEK